MQLKPKVAIPFELVAETLEDCCHRGANGKMSWSGTWLDDCQLILTAHEAFGDDIDVGERRGLVWQAINDAARKGKIDSSRLLAALHGQVRRYLDVGFRPFVYLTKLSIEGVYRPITLRVDGATVTISSGVPKKFDRSILDFHLRHESIVEDPPKYSWVRVRLNARTGNEAQSKASDVLDFIRGALNFGYNANTWSEHTSDDARPLNKILLGPNHTLHEVDGSSASSHFWYEPNFREYKLVRVDTQGWDRAFASMGEMRRAIRRSTYGDSLKRLVIRYCRALDSGAPSVDLLHLWSVLEYTTGAVDANYNVLVKRASKLFSKSEIVRASLEVMRSRRNRIVHAGNQEEARREELVMLHRFVAWSIMLAFQKSHSFSGFDEIGTFLSLSGDKASLNRGIELRKQALEFHNHGP